MNHRSIPPRLGSQPALSVLCGRRRSRRVVALPRLRFARYAVRSCSPSVPSLRLVLRAVTSGFTRYRLLALLRRSALLWLRSEGVHASGTRRPHQPLWGSLYGSAFLPTHTPTSSRYEKREALPPPFGVSNCYSSKPCTTVSSVEESNAFAASGTGR